MILKLTRWTVAHRRIVTLSWLILGLGLLGLSQTVGSRSAQNFSLPGTNSQHALDLLKSRFPAQAGDSDQIVFYSPTGKLTDASQRSVIVPLLERVGRLPHVTGVVGPYAAGAHAISNGGTIGFATVDFDESAAKVPHAAVKGVIKAAEAIRSPSLQVELGGLAIEQTQRASLGTATAVGLLAAMVVLLLAFGCGHVGCCDDSPNRHATAHQHATSHPIIHSLEPGEDWSWCYLDEVAFVLEGVRGTTRIPPSPLLN